MAKVGMFLSLVAAVLNLTAVILAFHSFAELRPDLFPFDKNVSRSGSSSNAMSEGTAELQLGAVPVSVCVLFSSCSAYGLVRCP